jgi:hypothetical protein
MTCRKYILTYIVVVFGAAAASCATGLGIFQIEPNLVPDPNNILCEPNGGRKIVSGAKAWALACSALLIEHNWDNHDSLEPSAMKQTNIDKMKRGLSEWWDIKDRESFFESIKWIEQEGHRTRFDRLGQEVSELGFMEFVDLLRQQTNRDDSESILVAHEWYPKLKGKSLLGWDLSRAIWLCRGAYVSGYITEDEAWTMIMRYAQILQETFGSWEDLGRNYLIGRRFWSYDETCKTGADFEEYFARLTQMPTSPWNRLPWTMDLSQP